MPLAALSVAGCAALGTATKKAGTPANVKVFAKQVPRIEMTRSAPCWQQRQHAKQEAFLDGTIKGRRVTYVADCDLKTKKKSS